MNEQSTIETIGDEGRLFKVGMLVFSLIVIYSVYLSRVIGSGLDSQATSLGGFVGRALLASVVAGIPFAVMAYSDPRWRSKHAAEIAVGTWALVFLAFAIITGGNCPYIAILLFIPLTFGALIGHRIGTIRHGLL